MTALSAAISDYCAAIDGLGIPEETAEELKAGVMVLLDATRRECFAKSPLTTWILAGLGHRFAQIEFDEDRKCMRCNLEDIDVPGDESVAVGWGESQEESIADAMNDLDRRAH